MDTNNERGAASGKEPDAHPAARRGINYQPVNWLVLIPLIGTFVPMFYNRVDPKIGGMPFFYWYQLLWIPISVTCTFVVYRLTRGERLMADFNGLEFGIVVALFLLVTVIGFAAARWRRAADLGHLDEWGLGGRSFGTWVTWFLVGGDLYTAYTFVAVPALVFGAGALGFFAVPYTIVRTRWSSSLPRGCGRWRTGRATSPPPTSSAAGTAPTPLPSRSRSPASSRRCPTSRCRWSASRPSSRRWASPATGR